MSHRVVCTVVALVLGACAAAQDAFYEVALSNLELVEGELSDTGATDPMWRVWEYQEYMRPRAVLDGAI